MAAHPTDAILGSSPRIAALRADIRRLAAFDAPGNPHAPTVLLEGETGTGKGLVARVIHDSGPRARAPFVDVNCAAIPETMLEAELFGFEAGAFTDARRTKPGLFEVASGGTLFLDEIDSLSRPVQSKVLKAIEEKRVRRLGAVDVRDIDVKLITATQVDLRSLVDDGAFRGDLYHRLAVLILNLPSLRERDEDVAQLAAHYLEAYSQAHGLTPKFLSASGGRWLRAQTWPGNVRELGHLLERVTLLSPGAEVNEEILASLAPGSHVRSPRPSATSTNAPDLHERDEESRIRAALARSGGNVVKAAKILGLGRNGLRYRMRRFGIQRPDVHELPDPLMPATPQEAARAIPVEPGPSTPSWELKATAVLAVSLSAPADQGAGYDPWTLVTRWERLLEETIQGFGGRLLRRSPSAFTAVFGLPRAVERLAERAVQAAMAIQRMLASATDPRPDLRTAVHAGEVQIDVNASDPLSQILPIGDTFALAERLVGHAAMGEVLVSGQIARRLGRGFDLSPRELRMGGDDGDRHRAHAAVRHASRAAGSGPADEAGTTPFIGREREIAALLDCFARVAAGHGQVVFIAGDAGMGKSRLLSELRRRLVGQPLQWIEGGCTSYGIVTPFHPIADGIRRYLGIDDGDDEAAIAAKIDGGLTLLGAGVAWTLPFLRQLLSLSIEDEEVVALDAASRRSEMFRALRALVLRSAEVAPVVLVIEDLHWIDRASEEFIAFLEDFVPATRVFLLLSHRSGYSSPFPARSYHQRVALAPLSSGETASMTSSIFGASDIPADLGLLIGAKAEGNPFFIEELAKSLLEQGELRREQGRIVMARALGDFAVPDTVQDVLLARIDRLEEEARRAIQVASVIGREFALRLLARLSEAGDSVKNQVDELRSLELIYEKALYPELAYMFKHALTHDVAYESVVPERRRALHCSIGSVIEDLYTDRLAEHYETLAHHYSLGGDWQRALLYHRRSAEKAAESHANRAVVQHCRAALEIAGRLGTAIGDDLRGHLAELLALAHFHLSEFAEAGTAYEQAAAWSQSAEGHSLNLGAAAFSHFWAHRYDVASRCIDRAIAVSRAGAAPAGEGLALAVRGFCSGVHDADLDSCERDQTLAIEIGRQCGSEFVQTFAHVQLVMMSEWTGEYAAAFALAETAISMARKIRRPELIVLPSWFLGKARCCSGDFGGAIALLEEAYQLCDRIGDRAWKSRLLNTLGWCYSEIGSVDEARLFNERAAVLAREFGDPEILSNADINLAMNHLELGQVDRALGYLEPVERAVAVPGDPWMRWRYTMHVRDARGRIELVRGAPQLALAAAEEQVAAARRYRAPKVVARGRTLAAQALLVLDRRAEASDALDEALAVSQRIGYRRGIWEAHLLLAEVARRAGDATRVSEHAARARVEIEGAARSLPDGPMRRGLLRRAEERSDQ